MSLPRLPFVVDEPARSRFRVNRGVFMSPELLELERDLVFGRCWLYVGHESEIPSPCDFRTRDVGGRPVIFTRDRDGQVQVLLNACTHRGAEVCRESEGNKRVHTCFYHGWGFDPCGRLVAV